MPDYGFGALAIGSGAQAGLQQLIRQRLLERQMALQEQAQRENMEFRNRSLDVDTAYRRDALSLQERNAEEMRKLREQGEARDAYYQEGQLVDRAANNTPNQQELPVNTAMRFKAYGQPVSGPSDDALNSPLANEALPPYRFEGNKPTASTKLLTPEEFQQRLDLRREEAKIGAQYDAPPRPYFTFPTFMGPDGNPTVYRGNARTGELTPQTSGDGSPLQPRLTGAEQTKVNSLAEAKQALQVLRQVYSKPGMRESVGPVAGRWNSAKTMAPESMADLPPGFTDLVPAIANYRNRVITAITGAQMGEKEADRIRQQTPELFDRGDMFDSKLAMSEKLMEYAYSRWARAEKYRANGIDGKQLQQILDMEMGPAPGADKTYLDPNTGEPIKR